jgi:hypothetical protein
MLPILPFDITGPAAPYLLIVFGFLALLVVNMLIALVEGVILTLLRWNSFRACITVSLIMNMISGIVNGILLVLLQHTPFLWLPISFVLSLIIEVFLITYFKREAIRQNIVFIFLANLASYLLIILPAYYFGAHP